MRLGMGHHVHVDRAGLLNDAAHRFPRRTSAPTVIVGRSRAPTGWRSRCARNRATWWPHRRRRQCASSRPDWPRARERVLLLRRDAGQPVALDDMDHLEVRAGPGRDPRGAAHQGLGLGAAGDADDHPFTGLPGVGDVLVGAVFGQRGVDLVGQPQQRQLSERVQVSGSEIVLHRRVDLLGRIDVAVNEPAPQALPG